MTQMLISFSYSKYKILVILLFRKILIWIRLSHLILRFFSKMQEKNKEFLKEFSSSNYLTQFEYIILVILFFFFFFFNNSEIQ